jgi:ketosteroid isomerase-like protein
VPPPVDLEAERASLMAADKAWSQAYSTSETPVDVLVDQFVEGGAVLAPGGPIAQGKEAVRAAFTQLETIPGFDLTFAASSAHVGGGGDLGYTIGTYEMTLAPEGQPIHISGKYMTVWQKQDGVWMVAADMFNDNGPPSPSEEPVEE